MLSRILTLSVICPLSSLSCPLIRSRGRVSRQWVLDHCCLPSWMTVHRTNSFGVELRQLRQFLVLNLQQRWTAALFRCVTPPYPNLCFAYLPGWTTMTRASLEFHFQRYFVGGVVRREGVWEIEMWVKQRYSKDKNWSILHAVLSTFACSSHWMNCTNSLWTLSRYSRPAIELANPMYIAYCTFSHLSKTDVWFI